MAHPGRRPRSFALAKMVDRDFKEEGPMIFGSPQLHMGNVRERYEQQRKIIAIRAAAE